MDKKLHTDLMILSGHTYKNGNFELPNDWQKINSYSKINGLQATVYKKGNKIIISYSGTNSLLDFLGSDIPLGTNSLPIQYKSANKIYKETIQNYAGARIIVTGHSLGGSLAQLISAANGCLAVTFNAYSTAEILKNAGCENIKNLNIINYGNPNDSVFASMGNEQPGRTFITNTDLNNEYTYFAQKGINQQPNLANHKIENMGALDDAVEVTFSAKEYGSGPFQLYAEKTFTREDIAKMSKDEFAKNEQQIMKQLKNGTFAKEKPDYKNFTNPNTGSKKIYTKEELAKMTPDEFMKNESEIMGQLQSIGLPAKSDLPQKYSNSSSANGKWVTINGNHVLIEK